MGWERAVGGLALVGLALAVSPARFVAIKLAAAWGLPVLALVGLRASPRRALVAAALAVVDLALLARLDTGISVAIAGVGLLAALAAAAQDALFTDQDAATLGAFGRYRPFVTGQAIAVLSLAALIVVWALRGLLDPGADLGVPQRITAAAMHALVAAAALFGAAAALLWTRRQPRRAAVWASLAAVLLLLWAARGPLIDTLLDRRGESAARVAAIVDPAYALLADDRAFAKGLTAWRETAAPEADVAGGQGFFGAQVLDAGVLLSIENDYLPVLILRESGALGLARLALLTLGLALALGLVGAGRFAPGSLAARSRRVVAFVLGALALYQPVAALGALPFTGVTWPGLGIDSPSDLWIFVGVLLFVAVLGDPAPRRVAARLPRRARWLVAGAAIAAAAAGVLTVARVGAFALRRREPVEQRAGEPGVTLLPPFQGLEAVFDYAYRMQCPAADLASFPRPLFGEPQTPALERFQTAFIDAWDRDAPAARAALGRVRAGEAEACSGTAGRWRLEPRGGACRMSFKLGWPEVRVWAAPDTLRCEVDLPEDVLRAFRYPLRRPYAGARVRLVARALGDAADDLGELVSGAVVVRLRPGAGLADASRSRAGISAAEKVAIGADVEVLVEDGVAKVRRTPGAVRPARLLVVEKPRVHLLEPSARWQTRVIDAATPLTSLSVIVVGAAEGRNVWLFRPPAAHPGEAPAVDPLLADDVTTVLGSRRRHYVHGGLLPELGWVHPGLAERSLGLDGWIHAAVERWERAPRTTSATSPQARFAEANCGTLAPPSPSPGAEADAGFERVCARSPLDGVLECRVSLQPELETRLRHLLELTAARPELFAAKKPFRPATAASFALLSGETGEILAQGTTTPGRESTAYAPTTPSLEKYLLAARDDRDLTGARLAREETGAEKADWPEPIAVGSTMKPLLARALERVAPGPARRLVLTALGPRAGCEPILGHCPPTTTLWNHTEAPADLNRFLGSSLNWVQAAIGLLGTAWPDGELGFGDGPPVTLESPIAVETPVERLWTRRAGRDIIRGATVDEAALRATPMWRDFEALLGRPLCTGDKTACVRDGARRDLCAARALPIDGPSSDLRHLVATGPSSFDFADESGRGLVKEYLQLLRGSGKHPLASTLQLADAMNRLFFDPGDAPYRLAASWFPVAPPAGVAPPPPCGRTPSSEPTVAAGLCRALQDGTAAGLAPRLADPDLVFYGAKTGTIDSLGDIVENRRACEAWNRAHTIPGGGADQPYHLDCGSADRRELNDSLLVLAFGVRVDAGRVVPLTLALRYQRSGSAQPYGYAVYAAEPFLDLIADYFQ